MNYTRIFTLCAALAAGGFFFATSNTAEAGYGHSHFGHGHSHFGHGHSHYQPRAYYHDTSHYHYVPGRFYRHGNHFHYQPGGYYLHRTGHWHIH